jgi:hypothetical protein
VDQWASTRLADEPDEPGSSGGSSDSAGSLVASCVMAGRANGQRRSHGTSRRIVRDPGNLTTRRVSFAVAIGALAAVVIGVLDPAHDRVKTLTDSFALHATFSWWLRIALTTCEVMCVLYAPGLLLRSRLPASSMWRSSAFVWIPGFLYLVASGLVAWGLAAWVDPQVVGVVFTVPIPVFVLVALHRRLPGVVFERGERTVAVLMLLLVVVGIGKATWSQGPTDELYGGSVSRSLEVGNRSDSRVPYHAVQLVANAAGPYSGLAKNLYAPWSFSDRSPMAGLATVDAVFTSGASPPTAKPEERWAPFDAQGFAAYRIAMMAFAATILFSIYGTLRARIAQRLALGAVALVALTPFVVHEVYFTWPKLLSASFAFAAFLLLYLRKPGLSGLVVGLAYLAHPAAIFVVPTLLLTWFVVLRRELAIASLSSSRRWLKAWLKDALLVVTGVAVVFLAWRFLNAGHLNNRFVDYISEADGSTAKSLSSWTDSRLSSLGNTLVPFRLLIANFSNWSIDSPRHPDSFVKAGFLYWATIPLGVGLLYFPLYVFNLWTFARRKAALFFALLGIPFVLFWLYWGDTITGMLREGLQFWFVSSLIVAFFACVWLSDQRVVLGLRWLATARGLSVLVMLWLPTLASSGLFGDQRYELNDVISLILMAGGTLGLATASFRLLNPKRLALNESESSVSGCAESAPASQRPRRPL